MVTVNNYTVQYEQSKDAYRIICRETLFCPACNGVLSGYDTRRRHIVDSAGDAHWLLLQRLRCSSCGKLHIAAPPFVVPKKHYNAETIADVKAGREALCPADNSTMRRWRR